MSDSKELFDLLGRNTLCLRAELVSVVWSASEKDGAVEERLQANCRVTIESRDQSNELRTFADRYHEGTVTLMPLRGEHDRNDKGEPLVGVLFQHDAILAIRILVQPSHLTGLATLVTQAPRAPFRISVWPYRKLWEWNGEGHLDVRYCEIVVGPMTVSQGAR